MASAITTNNSIKTKDVFLFIVAIFLIKNSCCNISHKKKNSCITKTVKKSRKVDKIR